MKLQNSRFWIHFPDWNFINLLRTRHCQMGHFQKCATSGPAELGKELSQTRFALSQTPSILDLRMRRETAPDVPLPLKTLRLRSSERDDSQRLAKLSLRGRPSAGAEVARFVEVAHLAASGRTCRSWARHRGGAICRARAKGSSDESGEQVTD